MQESKSLGPQVHGNKRRHVVGVSGCEAGSVEHICLGDLSGRIEGAVQRLLEGQKSAPETPCEHLVNST